LLFTVRWWFRGQNFMKVVVPRAEFHESKDTIADAMDSLLILGHTHFFPEPIYLSYFMEDIFEQYIDKSERTSEYKCSFIFNESVEDSRWKILSVFDYLIMI